MLVVQCACGAQEIRRVCAAEVTTKSGHEEREHDADGAEGRAAKFLEVDGEHRTGAQLGVQQQDGEEQEERGHDECSERSARRPRWKSTNTRQHRGVGSTTKVESSEEREGAIVIAKLFLIYGCSILSPRSPSFTTADGR